MLCKFVLLALTAAQNDAAAPEAAPVPKPNAEISAEPEADAATDVVVPETDKEIEAKADEAPKESPKAVVPKGTASGGHGNAVSKTQEDAIATQEQVAKDVKDEEENVDLEKVNAGSNVPEVAAGADTNSTVAPVVVNNATDANPEAKTDTTTGAAASTATLFVAALVSFAF